jgi:hypothetical protein
MIASGVPRTLADELLDSPPAELRSNVLTFIGEERARAAVSRAQAEELLAAAARIDVLVGEMSAAVGAHHEARAAEPLALEFDATVVEVGRDKGGGDSFVWLAAGRLRPRFRVTTAQATRAASSMLYREVRVNVRIECKP